MYSVGSLAKQHGLSRSTLLYYHRMGLLEPTGHAKGEYRRYSAADARRLSRICEYRKAGLSLKEIGRILGDPGESRLAHALERRLTELNKEMTALRNQQRLVAGLLGRKDLLDPTEAMDKETWCALLVAAGFTEADQHRWHVDFERTAPEKHLRFLRMLNIPEEEIAAIRSRAGKSKVDCLSESCPAPPEPQRQDPA